MVMIDVGHVVFQKKVLVTLINIMDSYLKSLIVNRYGRKYFKILKNKDIKFLL